MAHLSVSYLGPDPPSHIVPFDIQHTLPTSHLTGKILPEPTTNLSDLLLHDHYSAHQVPHVALD